MTRRLPAFVIAGAYSGVGKTTVALGIMAALQRRGLNVQPFKIGPDFIDPGLHSRALATPSYNLDGWMLSRKYNLRSFQRNIAGKDVAILEGVMGLYDGRSGLNERGSTAEMAKLLGLPVVLVVDASAMARSAAALVLGYRLFDHNVDLVGVIFNKLGGKGHLRYLREALGSVQEVECLGGIPLSAEVKMEERHLGLMTAEEDFLDRRLIGKLARLVENHVDLDRLLHRTTITSRTSAAEEQKKRSSNRRVPIAVARDNAFCFYYPDNLDFLEAAGAELKPFSPLSDPGLPAGVQGIYLGGGYPELYAEDLSRNRSMRMEVKNFIEAGGPVYAECGGLMYLAKALIDQKNREYPMVGIYPFKTRMLSRLAALGYREVTFKAKSFLPHGQKARGHEFHYSEPMGAASARHLERPYATSAANEGTGCKGYLYKNCLASYVHLHFGSNPSLAKRFVAACSESGK